MRLVVQAPRRRQCLYVTGLARAALSTLRTVSNACSAVPCGRWSMPHRLRSRVRR